MVLSALGEDALSGDQAQETDYRLASWLLSNLEFEVFTYPRESSMLSVLSNEFSEAAYSIQE
jgi:hypothetical protein